MDKIIAELKELKKAVAAGTTTINDVDKINHIIRMCEKKKELVEAAMNPVPGQMELLPVSELDTNPRMSFIIESATFNFYGEKPPTLEQNLP